MVAWYNMIPNLVWSVLNLTPISVFCYQEIRLKLLYIFLAISLLALFVPASFFNTIQLGTTTSIYRKIGVRYLNKFTQNGEIINGLIRKKFPHYKIISNSTRSINKLIRQIYIFEKFHFILFLFFALATIYALRQNYWQWTIILCLTNLAYNIYPNLLQQYIRIRLTTLLKRPA